MVRTRRHQRSLAIVVNQQRDSVTAVDIIPPQPVDRRKTGSKHHLICDGKGAPLKVITTAANVNDVTRTLALVDGIPAVAGRPGRPCRRPAALLGDKGYDSNPNRWELCKRRILPVISRKGPRTSGAWESSGSMSSRPSRCCTSSSAWPSAGKGAPTLRDARWAFRPCVRCLDAAF
ncbi:transposase [Streptomyces olivoreticuli]|uniref:transposase n=1 Tax=Streptomyces olivoreticuli TaxID=68246 RepID=UPI003CC8091E